MLENLSRSWQYLYHACNNVSYFQTQMRNNSVFYFYLLDDDIPILFIDENGNSTSTNLQDKDRDTQMISDNPILCG